MIQKIFKYAVTFYKERPIKQAFMKFGKTGIPDIPTHTKKSEREALFNLAASLPAGSSVLEIGSYLGASTCYLAAGAAQINGHLYCVDTWQNETMPDGLKDTYSEFCQNTSAFQKYITPLRKKSSEITAGDFEHPIALVFLDGDHSYEAVSGDYKIVSPFLAANAILAFHDHVYFEGVVKVIGEILSNGNWLVKGVVANLIWLQQKKPQNANN